MGAPAGARLVGSSGAVPAWARPPALLALTLAWPLQRAVGAGLGGGVASSGER